MLPRVTLHSPVYTVQPGDTLSEITSRLLKGRKLYGLSSRVNWLLELNPKLKDANAIYPGQEIVIYAASEMPTEARTDAPTERAPAREPSNAPAGAEPPEPVATPEPLATPVALKEESQSYSWVVLRPQFGFYRIDSIDRSTFGSATILSTLSPGPSLDWEPILNSTTQLRFGASFARVTQQAPLPKSLTTPEITFSEFHAAGLKKLANPSQLGPKSVAAKCPLSEPKLLRSSAFRKLRSPMQRFSANGLGTIAARSRAHSASRMAKHSRRNQAHTPFRRERCTAASFDSFSASDHFDYRLELSTSKTLTTRQSHA